MRDLVVIGGGIFGCAIAEEAANKGLDVLLLEQRNDVLEQATANNQNRLHLGLHYPRDSQTAQQSVEGARLFEIHFSQSVNRNFANFYFIARDGSMTNADQFEAFARSNGLPMERLTTDEFRHTGVDVDAVEAGWLVPEGVIDVNRLRSLLKEKLHRARVEVRTNTTVTQLKQLTNSSWRVESQQGADLGRHVVLATYDLDSLTPRNDQESNFQQVIVPVARTSNQQIGVTIMDGDFATVLPRGFSNEMLIYSPVASVLSSHSGYVLDPLRLSDFSEIPSHVVQVAQRVRDLLPGLQFELTGELLATVRRVPARCHSTDQRRSTVSLVGPNCYRVHSGKVDHCVSLAQLLVEAILKRSRKFRSPRDS